MYLADSARGDSGASASVDRPSARASAPSNSTRCSVDAGPEAIGATSAWSRRRLAGPRPRVPGAPPGHRRYGPTGLSGPQTRMSLIVEAVVYGSGTTGLHTAVSRATLHGPSSRCGPGGMVCGFRFRNLLRCADQVGHVGDLALLRVDDQPRHVLGGWVAAVRELGLRHGHRALVMTDHRGNPHRVELGAGQ